MKQTLTPRERVERMLAFKSVDVPALECDVNSVGIYEHGEKVRELFKTLTGDFGPTNECPYDTVPGPETYDPDGRAWLPRKEEFDEKGEFHRYFRDDWGVEWEYRIFGVQGHPYSRPLDDWAAAASYKFPDVMNDEQLALLKADVEAKKNAGYFTKRGWVNIMERTYSLRRFEDVLMDIALLDDDFMRFTERFCEHDKKLVRRWLETGCDAIQFADDFGTQTSLLISPESFRTVYKPCYKQLVKIVHDAGKHAFFHCCGYCEPLLEDFAEIGFDTLWPQVSCHELPRFAKKCRELGIAVAIHPDRSELMTNGTPDDIKRAIDDYYRIFRPEDGGAWFYLEIDNGFPFQNLAAEVEAVKSYRSS